MIDVLGIALVIFVLIVFGIIIFSPQKKHRRTNKSGHAVQRETSKKANTIKVTITESNNNNVDVSKSYIVENNDLNLDVDKKEDLYKFFHRNYEKYDNWKERNHNHWLAYRLITTYKDLIDSANFYDFEKNAKTFCEIKNDALEKQVTMSNIMVAIRYCRLQYYQKECNYKIKRADIKKLEQWKEFSDKEISIEMLINNYKEYWDEVLANYKRPSARTNRLKYLVEKLTEIREKPYIQESQLFIDKIDALKAHYSEQLMSQISLNKQTIKY